ncbi:divalent-cation tolerance protein CutA [bacterium]|nr:divalent-cation tolerance protein CutA [bacterium]
MTALLKKKLIACANILNYAKSYYLWEGKIKKDEEKFIMIKYPKGKEEELLNFIKKLHPYKIPELIILNPEKVDGNYLEWIHEACK